MSDRKATENDFNFRIFNYDTVVVYKVLFVIVVIVVYKFKDNENMFNIDIMIKLM